MTMLILEGFDHYGTGAEGRTNMLAGAWAEVTGSGGPAVPAWGTRTGAFALSNGDFTGVYRRVLPAPKNALILSCGFSVPALPSLNLRNAIIAFCDGGNAVIAQLWVSSTGTLELRDAAGTLLGATQAPVIVAENWHLLEMKIDVTADTFELHVDDADGSGTPAMALTGLTLAGPVAQLHALRVAVASGGQVTAWMDDLAIRDTSGALNNAFSGDLRVATLYPRADDATFDGWTPRYRKEFGVGILDNRADDVACVTAGSSASTDLGAADFCIEQFVRFYALPSGATKAVLFGKWDEAGNRRSYQLYLGGPTLDSGALVFRTSTNGLAGTVVNQITWPWDPELNVWYHVAVVRDGGELLLWIDGVQYGLPVADATTYYAGAAATVIGGQYESGPAGLDNTAFNGFLDEVRLSVGVPRYTAPFTPTGPFPRNSTDDPDFASVALLCGFDSGINDESSYGRALTARGDAVQNTPDDGPDIGAFSAINQATPRDDTFIDAALLPAGSTLTLDAQPANNDTVTVGTKDGATPAVYRFRTVLAAAYDVLIDTTTVLTLQNLYNAINAGPGIGVKYGAATLVNFDVSASQLPGDQMAVTALTPGTAGNAIATSDALTNGGGWDGATLSGGANIPGPSDFYMDRPPPLTTVVKAVSVVQRAYKSDAGACNVRASFVGPLATASPGVEHPLTLSPVYYQDIFETDPDTGNAITPSTIVGGRVRLTRTV